MGKFQGIWLRNSLSTAQPARHMRRTLLPSWNYWVVLPVLWVESETLHMFYKVYKSLSMLPAHFFALSPYLHVSATPAFSNHLTALIPSLQGLSLHMLFQGPKQPFLSFFTWSTSTHPLDLSPHIPSLKKGSLTSTLYLPRLDLTLPYSHVSTPQAFRTPIATSHFRFIFYD